MPRCKRAPSNPRVDEGCTHEAVSVERRNSSDKSILSLGGVVQVYHRLQVQEEEEKVRKVEQEVEREDQGEETARTWMAMEMT